MSGVLIKSYEKIHSDQIHAKILDHLAQQKNQTDLLGDAFVNAYEAAGRGLDKLLDKSKVGKIPVIGDFLKGQARAQLTNVFRSITDKIFGTDIKNNPMMTEAQKQTAYLASIDKKMGGQSVNGGLGSIFSGLMSGQGPGGTPNFNPLANGFINSAGGGMHEAGHAGGQSSGGGILSQLTGAGGMFGPKANLLKGGKLSSMGGMASGIGMAASMAGGLIGGRAGNVLSMAGMGIQIGSMFGPWGALIGGIGGGLAGLFMGGDNSIKKLKSAALSEYSLTVSDKTTLNALKAIGEGYFGKGKVGANAIATVRTDEAKDILRNYAEMTGQKSSKLTDFSDENYAGNRSRAQFGGFRAMGGPVFPGMSYIVGERRAELFTPTVGGHISPSVSTSDPRMMGAIMQTLDAIHEQLARIDTLPPDEVLRMGANSPRGARAIAEGYHKGLNGGGSRATEGFMRQAGQT